MLDSPWLDLSDSIVIGLVLSFQLEQVHHPRPLQVHRRRFSSVLIHSGFWIALFIIEFVQFYRPWLAMLLVNAIFYVLILINHAKYSALKEPFIYQDFDYFTDAIRHPRLYLPFFGLFKIALCLLIIGIALWIGVSTEESIKIRMSRVELVNFLFLAAMLAWVLIWAGSMSCPKLTFRPLHDFQQNGLIASLWHYRNAQRLSTVRNRQDLIQRLNQKSSLSGTAQEQQISSQRDSNLPTKQYPHTVVVQSESFFDPRRTYTGINRSILQHFDQACQESHRHGTLKVPAWGANTVRTEFEFLTGISTDDLGIDQFSPYRRLIDENLVSIARLFQSLGYKTICVHPYPASFYHRDKVFPLLGFDEFIDIRSFDSSFASNHSSYITDQAVTDRVISLLGMSSNSQPLFIFVITMENHGPLHLEKINEQEANTLLSDPLPEDCTELAIYLRHIFNADQMIERLKTALNKTDRGGQLLWYGDHVPVMGTVYNKLGMPDGFTDYFLWKSYQVDCLKSSNDSYPMIAHQLAVLLLDLSDHKSTENDDG